MEDSTVIEDSLRVADAHPRGANPFGPSDYRAKFHALAGESVTGTERERFLAAVEALPQDEDAQVDLSIRASGLQQSSPGLFV